MGWKCIAAAGLNYGTIVKGNFEAPVSAITHSRADIAAVPIENVTAQKVLTKLRQAV
ncbi:MAG: hypothetical protein ACE3NC_06700 [Candidatus Wallacebacter cryptica]